MLAFSNRFFDEDIGRLDRYIPSVDYPDPGSDNHKSGKILELNH